VGKKEANHEIPDAILQLKKAIDNHRFEVRGREKNNRYLAKTGMTPRERLSIIRGLQIANYVAGPEQDYNSSDDPDIWTFKRGFQGHEIYIKIKLIKAEEDIYAICVSFHD
jgi:hypothetical protein